MNNFITDEATGDGGIFRERECERTQGVQRRVSLGLELSGAQATASSAMGKPTVASGRVQLRRMASATATRMELAALILCFSRLVMYFSKSSTVTRPAEPLPATPAKIRRVQTEFVHARFEARRKVARTGSVGGYG